MPNMSNVQYNNLQGLEIPADHKYDNSTSMLSMKSANTEVPETFDPVKKWPACADTIKSIHNQGTCGSCWAFATGHALDARMCIATNAAFGGSRGVLSRGHVASCSPPSGSNGCSGGYW